MFNIFGYLKNEKFYPEDASESQIPRNKIPSEKNLLYTYQEYNAANGILGGIVASLWMVEGSTDSAKENLEEILEIVGFEDRSLGQLVEQLGQITPDNLQPFLTRLENSDLRGFYSEKATSLLNLPRENIKEAEKFLYSPKEYNAANYLLKVLSDATKKVDLYLDTKDFTNILNKLKIASENAVDQLVTQLIGTEEQIRLAASKSQNPDRSPLIETLCVTIQDASGQYISRERAFLLCQSLGLNDYRTIQGNALRDFESYRRFIINGDTTAFAAHYTNCIINGNALSPWGVFSDSKINGNALSPWGVFSDSTITGDATGSAAQYIDCTINGAATTNNAEYTNCTIMGRKDTNARYIACTFPNES
jgi:hypothetical protein